MATQPSKALFPVSLNNDVFSTEKVVPAIHSIAGDFDQVIVLIADEMQFYNRVARSNGSRAGMVPDFLGIEEAVQKTSRDRARWFSRLKAMLGGGKLHDVNLSYLTLADRMDERAFRAFRRVLVLYDTCEKFREDVDASANRYARPRSSEQSSDASLQFRMSRRYILEEVAMSVRVRVEERIGCEFYIGATLEPIAKLYGNSYGVTPWAIAGIPNEDFDFYFFEHQAGQDANRPVWVEFETRRPYDEVKRKSQNY